MRRHSISLCFSFIVLIITFNRLLLYLVYTKTKYSARKDRITIKTLKLQAEGDVIVRQQVLPKLFVYLDV
jgi:hypothetical protein